MAFGPIRILILQPVRKELGFLPPPAAAMPAPAATVMTPIMVHFAVEMTVEKGPIQKFPWVVLG